MCLKQALFAVVVLLVFGAGHARAEVSFDLHQETFISPSLENSFSRDYVFAGLHLRSQRLDDIDGPVAIKADVRGEVSSAIEASYLNPRELFLKFEGIVIGRKRFHWSGTDEMWKLGLFQPQFRWNPLLPEEQGLIGGFYHFKGKQWGFVAYGSPIFLPDQGPGYTLQSGQFKTVSPWFQTQAATVRLTGSDKVRTLDYDVQNPPLDRLVLSPGGGLSLDVGSEDSPAQMRLSSAYKPANQINLGVDGTAEPTEKAHIYVIPTTFYHFVNSADVVVRSDSLEWTAGALHETSQEPRNQKAGYSYVTYRPMLLSSTSLAWKDSNNSVRLAALYRNGGEPQTVGQVTNDISALFSDRIPYRDAVALTASTRQPIRAGQNVSVSMTWLQGISSNYKQLTTAADFAVNRNWSVWSSLLMVQADDKSPTLFRDHEDDDSIRFGVTYVF